jgi:hypothetical protein
MRLIYAGLFILAGFLGEFFLVELRLRNISIVNSGWSLVVTMVILIGAAFFLFQERGPWVKRNGVLVYRRPDELVADTYHARRALELRNPDSEESWYLIELENGKILCLCDNLPSGPMGFAPLNPVIRIFPCTEFSVLRHPAKKFTARIDYGGKLIEPVSVLLADHYSDWVYTHLPNDGELIPDRTFDAVLAELQELSRKDSGDSQRQGF